MGRFAIVIATLSAAVYWAFATGGGNIATGIEYYDTLAQAFLAGQLHLTTLPRPELLALPDPYDEAQNEAYRLHDASLYGGRYYLYWGPLPGLLHAAWRLLTGSALPSSIVDITAATVAATVYGLTLLRIREQILPRVPRFTVWLATVAFAFGGVTLFMVAIPGIYNEAPLLSIAFVMLAWYSLTRAYLANGLSGRWALVAGAALACATATRITYAGYALGLAVALAWVFVRELRRGKPAPLLAFAGALAPLALTGVLLAAYNILRFGSPFEFGMRYALTGVPGMHLWMRDSSSLGGAFLNLHFLPAVAAVYLLAIPSVAPHFPFLPSGWMYQLAFPPLSWFPGDAYTEMPGVSLFIMVPSSMLAVLLPAVWPRIRHKLQVGPSVWLVLVSAISGTVATFVLVGSSRAIAPRYMGDVLPGFQLVGALSLMFVLAAASQTPKLSLLWRAVAVTACGISIAVGLVFGLGGWQRQYAAASASAAAPQPRLVGLTRRMLDYAPLTPRRTTLEAVANPNGRDVWEGKTLYWLGQQPMEITVYSNAPGWSCLTAVLAPGPSIPEDSGRWVRMATPDGYNEELAIDGTLTARWTIPVQRGLTNLQFSSLDQPSVSQTGPGDTRSLLVAVTELQVKPHECAG